jgi:hypothetical protein
MLQANVKIIAELKQFVTIASTNKDLLRQFSVSAKDFIRTRKLPFEKLVLLIAKLCKKTLSIEIETFFEEMSSTVNCSVSAFTQQRLKLEPSFFYWWNQL